MSRSRLEPFFLDTPAGRLFLLLRAPPDADRCVLFVPPFGEEMNKCRRQVTETAELLVLAGYAVLLPDLFGTGDSAGEFHEATWNTWRHNIVSAIAWSGGQGLPVDAVVATRLACLLAAQALKEAQHTVDCTAFWQPIGSGQQFMTQFLRLRVATSMMQDSGKETVDELKARLQRGDSVQVAGYSLGGALWQAIDHLELEPLLHTRLGRLSMWEIGRGEEGELSILGKRLLRSAIERGLDVSAGRLSGEPFWSSTEIVFNPELARRTADFIAADVA